MIAARIGGIASVQLTHRLIVFRRANPGGGLTRNRLDGGRGYCCAVVTMVSGSRLDREWRISTPIIEADIRHSRQLRLSVPRAAEVSPTEGVYVAATKARPATAEPVKRTAARSSTTAGAKGSTAKSSNLTLVHVYQYD